MKEFQLANTDASQTFDGVPLDLGDLTNYAIQVTFTDAGLNGQLKLQGSLDEVTWTDIPEADQTVVSGAPHMWSVEKAGYRYVRFTWTYSSGSGNLIAKAFLKEFPVKGA
jgi:hypothetical protein